MEFNNEFSSNEILLMREKKLEGLFDKMDILQTEVDEKNIQISEIKAQIQILEKRNLKLMTIKKTLQFEPRKLVTTKKHINNNGDNTLTPSTKMNKSSYIQGEKIEYQFIGEHADIIKSKKDVIASLLEELDRKQRETEPIESFVEELQQNQTKMIIERSKVKTKLQKTLSERKRNESDIQNMNEQIKELEASIHVHLRIQKDLELAITGLLSRKDQARISSDNSDNLYQKNRDLQIQIDNINNRNDELQNSIKSTLENVREQSDAINGEISRAMKKIGWEKEKTKLTKELDEANNSLKESRIEFDNIQKEIKIIDNRLKKLFPLLKKWNDDSIIREIDITETDQNVDDILKILRKQGRERKKETTKDILNTENMIEMNNKLTSEIQVMYENLITENRAFFVDQVHIKKEIKDKRSNAFDREHNIISNIGELKIKYSKKKQLVFQQSNSRIKI